MEKASRDSRQRPHQRIQASPQWAEKALEWYVAASEKGKEGHIRKSPEHRWRIDVIGQPAKGGARWSRTEVIKIGHDWGQNQILSLRRYAAASCEAGIRNDVRAGTLTGENIERQQNRCSELSFKLKPHNFASFSKSFGEISWNAKCHFIPSL